jgi:hypothetical protein
MDLMGSDALQSEDAMREMWGDSIKAVKCQHARITYGDFLLLMKGQTKDTPAIDQKSVAFGVTKVEAGASSRLGASTMLHVVPEGLSTVDESEDTEEPGIIKLPSGGKVTVEGSILDDNMMADGEMNGSGHSTPSRPMFSAVHPRSAPTTPAEHKHMLDMEDMDSPLSMDEDDDITSSGPGVPGSSASLTPPVSPVRGFQDFVTPLSGRRVSNDLMSDKVKLESLMLPGLPLIPKPPPLMTRRRSRSVGDENGSDVEPSDPKDLVMVADVVRDLLFPETVQHQQRKKIDTALKDPTKSALVVNRKLYRAHRQMRLAVLDASKRFEEQQAAHAREVILAKREEQEEAEGKTDASMGMIQAGLVMRHGHNKQVSSKDIAALLKENMVQQQALVEKATRRGGRGRRSRKKTISDMSAMMSSMGQDELLSVAMSAALDPPPEEDTGVLDEHKQPGDSSPSVSDPAIPELPDLSTEGLLRGSTVPGEFRKTKDPFSMQGRYGAVAAAWDKDSP